MSAVTDVRYVGYGVADLEAERKFYRDVWKLDEVASDDGMIYFASPGSPHLYQVRLRETKVSRIDVVGLAADSDKDVDAIAEKVGKSGLKIISEPQKLDSPGGGYGFRFFSAEGLPFEVSASVASRTPATLQRWDAMPEKLSHVVFHSPDHKAMVNFFVDVLGFKVSDWLGDFMCFLRCNEWHHRIAVLPGPPCLDHVAYDMLTVDDMFRGIYRLKNEGTDVLWGPGRHTAGNNTFSYFQTPNGFVVEYTSELERIDEATWEPTIYKPSQLVMDQWSTGVGGPKTMPESKPDPCLFQPAEV